MFSPDNLSSKCWDVEIPQSGNVGLLRCLIVEKWRSLVGI